MFKSGQTEEYYKAIIERLEAENAVLQQKAIDAAVELKITKQKITEYEAKIAKPQKIDEIKPLKIEAGKKVEFNIPDIKLPSKKKKEISEEQATTFHERLSQVYQKQFGKDLDKMLKQEGIEDIDDFLNNFLLQKYTDPRELFYDKWDLEFDPNTLEINLAETILEYLGG